MHSEVAYFPTSKKTGKMMQHMFTSNNYDVQVEEYCNSQRHKNHTIEISRFYLPHKLHIFGHFLAIMSLKAGHIASVRDLPHSGSKSSQSPTRDVIHLAYQCYKLNLP